MHAQYFALINLNLKLLFCAEASFALLLILLEFRDRVRAFLRDFGERMVKSDDKPVRRVLVTSHGGFIKELNMVMVADHKCEMPCDHGEYGRISPNTGVTKFLISLDMEGKITSAKCTLLYYKDHLEGLEFHEPLNYGL